MEKYTAGDLILTTKDKLKELSDKLNRLEQLTLISRDKNIKKVHYHTITNIDCEKPILQCIVDWNDKRLSGKIKNLKVKFHMYMWGPEVGRLVRDNNGGCYILNNYYNVIIPNENQKEFGELSDEVLNDEFTIKFSSNRFLYGKEPSHIMDMNENRILVKNNGKGNQYLRFIYAPGKEEATLTSTYKIHLNDKMLTDLLQQRIYSLNENQREYIDNSPELNKRIFVKDFSVEDTKVDFKIEEDEKGLYLIKK